MTDATGYEMEDLTGRDVDRAHESLYYAVRRYCAITERSFVQAASAVQPDDREFVSIGDGAAELAEAGLRYSEAYARWQQYLPRDEPDVQGEAEQE